MGGQGGIARAGDNVDGEEITAFDFGYDGAPQGDREAGAYPIVFRNIEKDPAGFHEILMVRIAAHRGATKKQIIAAINAFDFCPSGCFFDYFAGGAFGAPSGPSQVVGPDFGPGIPRLLAGRYAYYCGVTEPNGTAHYKLGMFGTFKAK